MSALRDPCWPHSPTHPGRQRERQDEKLCEYIRRVKSEVTDLSERNGVSQKVGAQRLIDGVERKAERTTLPSAACLNTNPDNDSFLRGAGFALPSVP